MQAYADAVPDDATVRRRFDAIALAAPGCVSVEDADPGPPLRWEPAPGDDATLSAAPFDRRLDFDWRRTSYSNITAGAYEARVASEPEQGGVEDEPDAGIPLPGPAPGEADAALAAVPSLLGDMPPGARVGTFVHRVLEATDFAAPDLRAELEARVREALAWRAVDVGPVEAVVDGLQAAIATPLGPLAGGARLRDFARRDRLDELDVRAPARGRRRPRRHRRSGRDRRGPARAPPRRRPARPLSRPPRGPGAARRGPGLPHRQRRSCRAAAGRGRRPASPSSTTSPITSRRRACR